LPLPDAYPVFCDSTSIFPVDDVPVRTVVNVIRHDNWRENTGVLAALVEAGIVEDTGEMVRVGYEWANLCRILTRA
jgi:hypothetical protein